MRLLLASESTYRKRLLQRLGLPFDTCAHQCDERQLRAESLPELAELLARAKAQSVGGNSEHAFVIASDQIAEVDGTQLHKPETRERAIEQLGLLQGRSHHLHAAVALRWPTGQTHSALVSSEMTMRSLSRGEIEHYVDLEPAFDCCGAYRFEAYGITLFDRVNTSDPTAIEGMPIMALCRLLREARGAFVAA